jgi:chemotaxis protein CheC
MTATQFINLSELELDALTELMNLGVSNAALSLREMAREEVILSVPKVFLVTREEAIARLGEKDVSRLVGVHQDFEGDIRGRALLIFPEKKSIELVRAVIGGDLSLEEMVELEQEALAETGNVLLNGCLSTIANRGTATACCSSTSTSQFDSAICRATSRCCWTCPHW